MKVDSILNGVFKDLRQQITEMAQSYTVVEAILYSNAYITCVHRSIVKYNFNFTPIANIIAQFKRNADAEGPIA